MVDIESIESNIEKLESLKDLVMLTINGQVSPGTILVKMAQDEAQRIIAETKQYLENAKVVIPMQVQLGEEIAKLEVDKVPLTAKIKAKEVQVQFSDTSVELDEKDLETAKKIQAAKKRRYNRKVARAKAKGEPVPEQDNSYDDRVRDAKNRLDATKERNKELHNELDNLENDLAQIEYQIEEKKYQLKILAAQLNPAPALAEAKKAKLSALEALNSIPASLDNVQELTDTDTGTTDTTGNNITGSTNGSSATETGEKRLTNKQREAIENAKARKESEESGTTDEPEEEKPMPREEAQKVLEKAEEEEATIQQISDENEQAIENEIKKNEPKMMQLRAEYQIMDSGVATIQFLTSNIPTLLPAMTASIGANGGGPVPVLPNITMTLGNILYGYGFFVMATVKAASIRFLALAEELQYTPTSEMTIINQIATTETTWKSAMAGFAPAGATLI